MQLQEIDIASGGLICPFPRLEEDPNVVFDRFVLPINGEPPFGPGG